MHVDKLADGRFQFPDAAECTASNPFVREFGEPSRMRSTRNLAATFFSSLSSSFPLSRRSKKSREFRSCPRSEPGFCQHCPIMAPRSSGHNRLAALAIEVRNDLTSLAPSRVRSPSPAAIDLHCRIDQRQAAPLESDGFNAGS